MQLGWDVITSVWLNLSEILSKYEGYEYTNIIFKVVTHLF